MCVIVLKQKPGCGIVLAEGHHTPDWADKGDNPVTYRFSSAGLSTACLALFLGSAVVVAPVMVEAAPKRAATSTDMKRAKAKPVQPSEARSSAAMSRLDKAKSGKSKLTRSEPETTGSVSKSEPEQPGCDRMRRRMWVEGEGWIVRRVTTCQLTQN
jgi:hypothetical protein